MLIGHKGDSAVLNICINGLRIPPLREVLLLGFTSDHRLSWIPHLKRRVEAAKRVFHSLRSVEPIFLYGCSVWSPILSGKKGVGLLRSFQRLFTSSITKVFRTTSTESLLVLILNFLLEPSVFFINFSSIFIWKIIHKFNEKINRHKILAHFFPRFSRRKCLSLHAT